jgi:hypothetical protein
MSGLYRHKDRREKGHAAIDQPTNQPGISSCLSHHSQVYSAYSITSFSLADGARLKEQFQWLRAGATAYGNSETYDICLRPRLVSRYAVPAASLH